MRNRIIREDDPLEDFARREITLDGVAKVVYVAGSGPAVITARCQWRRRARPCFSGPA